MVKKILILSILLMFSLGLHAEEKSGRSFSLGAYGAYAYSDDFGGLVPAYGTSLSYGYIFNEDYVLALNLLRFQHHPGEMYQFAYGFTFYHYWKDQWGDLGIWDPFVTYSILLNQATLEKREGRALAHNTRISLGSELKVQPEGRLGLEAGWNYLTYAFWDQEPLTIQSLEAGLYWRWIF